MTERRTSSPWRTVSGGSARGGTRSSRSSAAFERDGSESPAPPPAASSSSSSLQYPAQRFNHSLRSVSSRVSLSEQFATTRREYDFGFDDGASLMAPSEQDDSYGGGGSDDIVEEDEDEDEDDGELTAAESSDGIVVVPPSSDEDGEDGAGERRRRRKKGKKGTERVRRSHYELLCLPPDGGVSEAEVRRAYFRLYDILRSRQVSAKYREMAEGYFGDVQVAFETLIGRERRDEYDFPAAVDEQDDAASSEDEVEESDEDAKREVVRRVDPRFVRRLRQQQEQESTEVGVQLDSQPLFSPQVKAPPLLRRRLNLPAAMSISHTKTLSFPSVSRLLEPHARRLRNSLKGPAAVEAEKDREKDLELYCTPPTVTVSSSVLATNVFNTHLPPAATLNQCQNLIPDAVPKDRPLEWYLTFLAPLVKLRFRQELFLRDPGLPEAALRKTLPDAVVELETDALNAASVTARASRALRLGASPGDSADATVADDEPVHLELSASVSRAQLTGAYAARLGIAAHKRVSPRGGTAFACADSGASSPWTTPAPLSGGQGRADPPDGAGALWRSYMDQLSRRLEQGWMPFYHSPPTLEMGYRFSTVADDTLGLPSGRPFTKQARSGLRRMNDDADVDDAGKGGSWTISGAATTGGVAGYLRYGKDMFSSLSSPSAPARETAQARGTWRDLLGFRLEAEVTAQKMKHDGILSRLSPWGGSEISHLAVRGLKKIGEASRLGLELGVSGASNAVVLSLYFSQRSGRRLVVPVMLFRDGPPAGPYHRSSSSSSSSSTARLLFWSAFLPALGLAAVDHAVAALRDRDAKKKKNKNKNEKASLLHQRRVAARRAEADALVALLAGPVLHRQRRRRGAGGLVVLSAKLGALDDPASALDDPAPRWTAPDEVADVTVAVAALVTSDGDDDDDDEGGRLWIPAGLRKSKLLGFWDPKPGRTKWLVVRYSCGGREGTKAVSGREELRLP